MIVRRHMSDSPARPAAPATPPPDRVPSFPMHESCEEHA